MTKEKESAIQISRVSRDKLKRIQKSWQDKLGIPGIKITQKSVIEKLIDDEDQKIENEEV